MPTHLATSRRPPRPRDAETRDLDIVEAGSRSVLAVDLGGDQGADHVVSRIGAALLNQLVVHQAGLRHRVDARPAHPHLPRIAPQRDVLPDPHLLAVSLGHAEHRRDDLDGKQRGEIGHHVELLRVDNREVVLDTFAHNSFLRVMARGVNTLLTRLRIRRCAGGSIQMIDWLVLCWPSWISSSVTPRDDE